MTKITITIEVADEHGKKEIVSETSKQHKHVFVINAPLLRNDAIAVAELEMAAMAPIRPQH